MPTSLLDLPNEVLHNIFRHIDELPFDTIEAISLSCKQLQASASDLLSKHLQRKRKFTIVAIGHIDNLHWDDDPQIRGSHPIVVLRDIIADPTSAYYIQKLIVGYLNPRDIELCEDTEEAELDNLDLLVLLQELGDSLAIKIQEVLQRLSQTLGGRDYTGLRSARTKIADICSGNADQAASVLIALLPNLQKLRIVDRDRQGMPSAFLLGLRTFLDLAMDEHSEMEDLTTFTHLSEVTLQGQHYGSSVPFLSYNGFGPLPSLRTMKGRCVKIGSWLNNGNTPCKVRRLEFYESGIDAEDLELCFSCIESLEHFTYSFHTGSATVGQLWEPRLIVSALRAYASKSLLSLDLTGDQILGAIELEHGEPFIESLRSFEVLEKIRLETMMLYQEISNADDINSDQACEKSTESAENTLISPQRFVDLLPVSTKRLRLVGSLSTEDAGEMLTYFPGCTLGDQFRAYLPNLKNIFFEDCDPFGEDLVGSCAKAGVKLKFWNGK